MNEQETLEEIIAKNMYVWLSDNGENYHFDAVLYMRGDGQGILLGCETADFESEFLGYFVGAESEKGVSVMRVHNTTGGPFRKEVHRASSRLEAYSECVRRARGSLERVHDELQEYTLGTIGMQERLREHA